MWFFFRRAESILENRISNFPLTGWLQKRNQVVGSSRETLKLGGFAVMVLLATWGQYLLDRGPRPVPDLTGLAVYALAVFGIVILLGRDSAWRLRFPAVTTPTIRSKTRPFHPFWLTLSLLTAVIAFLGSSNNRFHWWGVIAWGFCLIGWFLTWWNEPISWRLPVLRDGLRLRWAHLLVLAVLIIGVGFRYWKLWDLPHDVNSDHAEKLLDVRDVLNGEYSIFFPRNTGREALQFYLAAAMVRYLGMPLHSLTLQILTAFIGVLLLPALYLLGSALWSRTAGFWMMFLGAVSSWAVIPARVGLRYPFLPTCAAFVFAFLVRGLRSGRRSDFLWMGLFLGIGLYGYSPFRGMLLAIPVAFFVVWFLDRGWRSQTGRHQVAGFFQGMTTSLLVFIPMLHYILQNPAMFFYRQATRLSSLERPIEGDPLLILANNIRRAILMFHWMGDEVYVATIPMRPMLDPITGGMLLLGVVAVIWWTIQKRDVVPLGLLVAGFIMLLPSALNLAFPRENPSTVRAAGALPVALAVAALIPTLWTDRWLTMAGNQRWGWSVLPVLLALALVRINTHRIFVTYADSYCRNVLNASDAANLINSFFRLGGPTGNAFYVGYPYWFDSRLIGMWLGDLDWPHTVQHDELPRVLEDHRQRPGPKLYLVHPNDRPSLSALVRTYPRGWQALIPRSRCDGLGVVVFWSPP